MTNSAPVTRIALLLLLGAIWLSSAWPTPVQAQSFDTATGRTTLPLCKEGVDPATAQGQALALIPKENKNWLVQIFSKGSLYYRLRCDPLIFGAATSTGNYEIGIYRASLSVVNILILIVLLVVAFANILRYKIDTYSVKKALVPMVLGIVLANFALPIVWTITDFANVLTVTLINEATSEGTLAAFVEALISSVYRQGPTAIGNLLTQSAQGSTIGMITALIGIFGWAIVATGPFLAFIWAASMFLLLMPSILFLGLGIAMIARIYVLLILTACAPLAFASFGFPGVFKSKIWTQWWGYLINWTFMAPITFFWLWLAIQVYRASGSEANIATYLISLTCITMALKTPTNKGGSVMASLNSKIIEPLQKGLKTVTGITPGLTYARQKTPRDVSRFLSSRGWNYAKPIRAALEGIEAGNAKREASSTSVQQAKFYRDLSEQVQITGAKPWEYARVAAEKEKDRYRFPGLQRVRDRTNEEATKLAISLNPDELEHFNNITDEKAAELEAQIQALMNKRNKRDNRLSDPDGLAALAVMMADLGRTAGDRSKEVTSIEEIMKLLSRERYNVADLERTTKNLQSKRNGIEAIVPVSATSPNGSSNSRARRHTRKIVQNPAVSNADPNIRQNYLDNLEKLLQRLGIDLKQITAANLQLIKADDELRGLVAAALKTNQKRTNPVSISNNLQFALGHGLDQLAIGSTDATDKRALSSLAMGTANAKELRQVTGAITAGRLNRSAAQVTKDTVAQLLTANSAPWGSDLSSHLLAVRNYLTNLSEAELMALSAEKIYQAAGVRTDAQANQGNILALDLALAGMTNLYEELSNIVAAAPSTATATPRVNRMAQP
ncbi:MAG: Uncharacterized protein CEO22_479 [Candidatus Berkelbacteria bacterium Gr01-1014_85]|uniref:Uncharacterized protein n=1 Tax=Candidatus Berkelbacteria bacterium Gr01-1014_85 TaxID=2017150 RepID=A0A554JAS6_9BACT|nr:MAG: Uncharacterized protein CEO22_479 [Candidatus Berkelbacteria bacterium Gr01-1014_85]